MPTSPQEIRKYLAGVPYPASREKLLMSVEEEGAPANVLEILGSVGDREYADSNDIMSELGAVPV